MQKIQPFFWYAVPASEAAHISNYYKNIFKDACVVESEFTPSETISVISLTLCGQPLRIMCTGDKRELTEAISMELRCDDQGEIDYYWDALTEEGSESMCGWCKDKYGLSWQVQPKNMGELVSTKKGMGAMMKMKKIIIKELEGTN